MDAIFNTEWWKVIEFCSTLLGLGTFISVIGYFSNLIIQERLRRTREKALRESTYPILLIVSLTGKDITSDVWRFIMNSDCGKRFRPGDHKEYMLRNFAGDEVNPAPDAPIVTTNSGDLQASSSPASTGESDVSIVSASGTTTKARTLRIIMDEKKFETLSEKQYKDLSEEQQKEYLFQQLQRFSIIISMNEISVQTKEYRNQSKQFEDSLNKVVKHIKTIGTNEVWLFYSGLVPWATKIAAKFSNNCCVRLFHFQSKKGGTGTYIDLNDYME